MMLKSMFLLCGLTLLTFSSVVHTFGFPSYFGGQNTLLQPSPFYNYNLRPMPAMFPNNNPAMNPFPQQPQIPPIAIPQQPTIPIPTRPGSNVVTDSVHVSGTNGAASGAVASSSASGKGPLVVGGQAISSGSTNSNGQSVSSSSSVASSGKRTLAKPLANFPAYIPYNYAPQPLEAYAPYSANLVAVDYSQPQVPQYQYWNGPLN